MANYSDVGFNFTQSLFDSHMSVNKYNQSHDKGPLWWEYVPGLTNPTVNGSVVFYSICYPFLLLLCTVGSTLNLILLTHPKVRKNTTNCYMTAMAIGDLVFLWADLLKYVALVCHAMGHPFDRSTGRQIYPYMVFAKHWSMIFTDWVLFVFSLERLLAVLMPFRVKWVLRPLTARIIIVVLFVVAGVFAAERFAVEYVRTLKIGWPQWLLHWNEVENFAGLLVAFGLFFGILIIDIILVTAIKLQERSAMGQIRQAQKVRCNVHQNSNIILMADAALFLFAAFPTIVLNCLIEASIHGMYHLDPHAHLVADPICDVFHQCNYALPFYLYLLISKKYREDFVMVFGPMRCTVWGKGRWNSVKRVASRWHKRMAKTKVLPNTIAVIATEAANHNHRRKSSRLHDIQSARANLELKRDSIGTVSSYSLDEESSSDGNDIRMESVPSVTVLKTVAKRTTTADSTQSNGSVVLHAIGSGKSNDTQNSDL